MTELVNSEMISESRLSDSKSILESSLKDSMRILESLPLWVGEGLGGQYKNLESYINYQFRT